jgi:uncharacterized membrane protein YsdA (DUF1294 family)/cold shock CspA family protein
VRFEGTLKAWNDDRGFGFIAPARGDEEVFVHIKAFGRRAGRPVVGQLLTFEVEVGPGGRKRARNVQLGGAARSSIARREERPAAWNAASLLAIPLLIALYVGVSLQWRVSPLWAAAYAMASIVTFFAYAFDKTAATRGTWRTSEATLLGLGLACGWPGGLLAQQWLRHKSSKPAFRRAFWVTVAVNLAAFVVLNSTWIGSLRGR